MASNRKPVTPDQKSRDLQRELRTLEKAEPSPDRAQDLATLTRAAHLDRQLNLAMRAAELCLEDDPDAPTLLITAYEQAPEGEERLEAMTDLRDLARYLDRDDIVVTADAAIAQAARAWVTSGDDSERRYRLRTVQSLTSRELADDLRDELGVM